MIESGAFRASRSPGEKVIRFIEKLRAPDGKYAGQPLRLLDFQKDIIKRIYDSRKPDGTREVVEAVLSVARKNGKTSITSGLVLAHLCGPEAVQFGQIYSAAFDRNQAAIIHRLAASMVFMDDELRLSDRVNVKESAKEIVDPVSGSVYKALSAESRSKHGFSASFVIFDELAQFGTNRALYDVLRTSGGARDDALFVTISTQAPDDLALLSELLDYGEKVRRGEFEDPTFVSWLYAVPDELDPYDEANWPLANPALGAFRSLDEMRQFAEKARRMPSAERTFLNLYLNRRISSTAGLIGPQQWLMNAGEPIKPDDEGFDEISWYGGLDLSGKLDLTAFVLAGSDGEAVHLHAWFWTPEATLEERELRDRAPYRVWRQAGRIEAIPGTAIDFDHVARRIGEIAEAYRIERIAYDRWRIEDLRKAAERARIDLPLVEFGQGFKDMAPAVDDFEGLAAAAKLRHGGHPVLTWNVANIAVEKDPAGNRKLSKKRASGRIDGAVAAAMAIRGLMAAAEQGSVYDTEDLMVV